MQRALDCIRQAASKKASVELALEALLQSMPVGFRHWSGKNANGKEILAMLYDDQEGSDDDEEEGSDDEEEGSDDEEGSEEGSDDGDSEGSEDSDSQDSSGIEDEHGEDDTQEETAQEGPASE